MLLVLVILPNLIKHWSETAHFSNLLSGLNCLTHGCWTGFTTSTPLLNDFSITKIIIKENLTVERWKRPHLFPPVPAKNTCTYRGTTTTKNDEQIYTHFQIVNFAHEVTASRNWKLTSLLEVHVYNISKRNTAVPVCDNGKLSSEQFQFHVFLRVVKPTSFALTHKVRNESNVL